jgi:hypothetical protein
MLTGAITEDQLDDSAIALVQLLGRLTEEKGTLIIWIAPFFEVSIHYQFLVTKDGDGSRSTLNFQGKMARN